MTRSGEGRVRLDRGVAPGDLSAALAGVVGAEHVLVDPDLTRPYGTDWTRRWASLPMAVVRPGSTAEVSAAVQVCADRGIAVVPQGGNTGLVGGSVPHADRRAVVLSTRRLTDRGQVERATRQVVVGAGVTVGEVQRHARSAGLRYGVDLAARDSATVGGTVATNAGGVHVLAFGDSRRQVVGLQAVLADGSVVSRLGGLAKDNSGYDLSQLMVGSEGTLGIVTAVRLRLLPKAVAPSRVTLVGLPSVAAALPWLDVPGLTAAELLLEGGLALVERVAGLRHPLAGRHPVYLLLEVEGDLPDRLAELDSAVSRDLWAYRERHTEAIGTRGVVHKLDVAVPVAAVPDLVARLDRAWAGAVSEPSGAREAYVFGHLGDGNVHVNVVDVEAFGGAHEVESTVYHLVAELGGTVAAEHGVGVAKRGWVHLSRTADELAVQRSVKAALDPRDLLNPGVLLP